MIGRSKGKVIDQRIVREFAPSTAAASCSSRGMSWRPARKITIIVPVVVQTLSAMMHNRATLGPTAQDGSFQPRRDASRSKTPFGFESQAGRGGVPPSRVRIPSANPPPWRIQRNIRATATDEEIDGK